MRGTSVEENLALIDDAAEAINAHDWDRFVDSLAEDVVFHSVFRPEPARGRSGLREFMETQTNAFPDWRVQAERTFGQGDWVVREQVVTGTHTGPLLGPSGETIPPTNRPFRVNAAVVFKVESGKISEVRQYMDRLELLAQLGLAPAGPP